MAERKTERVNVWLTPEQVAWLKTKKMFRDHARDGDEAMNLDRLAQSVKNRAAKRRRKMKTVWGRAREEVAAESALFRDRALMGPHERAHDDRAPLRPDSHRSRPHPRPQRRGSIQLLADEHARDLRHPMAARFQGPFETFTTKPATWDADRETLIGLIDELNAKREQAKWPQHPTLERCQEKDWAALTYKHCQHHLGQFGCDWPLQRNVRGPLLWIPLGRCLRAMRCTNQRDYTCDAGCCRSDRNDETSAGGEIQRESRMPKVTMSPAKWRTSEGRIDRVWYARTP
jgi:hypothetical protein